MVKILIVCDGTATRVFDSRSGERIENVRKVTFSHEVGSQPIATIEVILPEIDITDTTSHVREVRRKDIHAKEDHHTER